MFQPVITQADFPALERDTLRWWKETNAFDILCRLRKGGPTFSFLDGPITANNPMGVHHAWGRTYKDLWQRYKAMRGYDLRWQNGFDCQGLWVEVNVEKDLGFKTKKDIENYGIAPFVILCKQRVLNFAAIQTEQSIRLGMWMDWNDPEMLRLLRDRLGDDPSATITLGGPLGHVTGTVEQIVSQLGLPHLGGSYFTFSDKNNYDIWNFLKQCHNQGWIYKGTDVIPWCWRCGTGISQHEIVTEGYTDTVDPGLTIRFPLLDRPGEVLLVWTTTPWTLPANIAAAVGPELVYLKIRQGKEIFYLSKGTTKVLKGAFEILGEMTGKEMEGWKYTGPFDEIFAACQQGGWCETSLKRLFANVSESALKAHRVILWDEVGEAEGTGIVHIAPGCGQEDFGLHKKFHLPVIAPLDENGVFINGFDWLTGKHVAEVTEAIIENLKHKGLFYRLEKYKHRYPQCWRCQTPLVFRLVDEWYIKMDSLRESLMSITKQTRWIPDFGCDRELDWLRNMHDWLISKKRYWGLALPIWECDACGMFEVIGSREELEARAVEGWDHFKEHTPHRPHIDVVKITCKKCGAPSSRIKDVGNPWLDAGIVAFSTLGYRTDMDHWKKWFPADFITESFPGQFRNWFYSLLTMAGVLENKPPTRTILGFATLLGEDGRAMHKSWGNSIEFNEGADIIGADVMRWMFCNQRYESDMLFGYQAADGTRRRFLLPLWNVYAFFITYANLDKWQPGNQKFEEKSDLDRWILARLQQVISEVTTDLDDFYAYKATKIIEEFIDDLSNWYVRRSRRRFWKSEFDADKQAAYSTLYEVLVALTKLLAPFVPFVTEHMYQNLVRSVDQTAPSSVHHCAWPQAKMIAETDKALRDDMGAVQLVVGLGHAVRAANKLKVRQPLSSVIVVSPPEQRMSIQQMSMVITEELNVKKLVFAENEAELVTYKLLPNNRTLGPKLGSLFPKLRAALEAVDPNTAVATLRSGQNLTLVIEGKAIELTPDEVIIDPQPRPGFAIKAEKGFVVALETTITPGLQTEGLSREFVRRVQELRKTARFEISDRIVTYYTASKKLADAVTSFADYIKSETLSVSLIAARAPNAAAMAEDKFDGETLLVEVARVDSL